jgi:hypothetical protein
MDLVMLVLVICLIGFLIYLFTTKIQMPPYWAQAIQLGALICIVLYLINRFGPALPNVLP